MRRRRGRARARPARVRVSLLCSTWGNAPLSGPGLRPGPSTKSILSSLRVRARRADEARDPVGDGLGHALLPGLGLDELCILRAAEDDHLDGDDRHVREDRAGQRAALLAPDL